jgi:hypothetical protein
MSHGFPLKRGARSVHPTLRTFLFCSQVDGCSDEEIQARFRDEYVLKAYYIHKKEEGKLVPT